MQRVGASESSSACNCGSLLAVIPLRRVDPKATSFARISGASSVLARSKNAASFGFDPGHPASI
eukprot:scaffold28828_cov62-Attheya_sp.AAC.4